MSRRYACARTLLLCSILLLTANEASARSTIDFEGLPSFFSPGASIPGISVSPGGGIADEAAVSLVLGITFPAGTIATSGTSVLGNLFAETVTIDFDDPVTAVSLHTVGSLGDATFGTITVEAYGAIGLLGVLDTSGAALGDSGAPESLIDFGALSGITSLSFSASTPGPSTFVIDDLSYTLVPEPGTGLLVGLGLVLLASTRREARS